MGSTHARITVRKSEKSRARREVQCLVDAGATMTVLPAAFLRALVIRPLENVDLGVVDGTSITRADGRALVEFRGRAEYSPVVFGEEGDASLLGMLTLRELRLSVDPPRRELRPLRMQL